MTPRRIALTLVLFGLAVARPAAAQRPADAGEARMPLPVDSPRLELPSPRGAALRSLVVPGWGQAEFGSYVRGGVFFVARTASWFMLLKTLARIGEAEGVEERLVAAARDSIEAALPPDSVLPPLALEEAIAAVPAVEEKRDLVNARKEQREDWIAWVLFWTLADAADAYVNAQLADFPAEVDLGRRRDGAVELRVQVPVGTMR